jgi:hypothetical protein
VRCDNGIAAKNPHEHICGLNSICLFVFLAVCNVSARLMLMGHGSIG